MRVAIIGTGIGGNAAAWALSKRYPITIYEREQRIGGHSHTIDIDYDGTPIAVDIGFIVYNELNYPDFTALLRHLGVETIPSCMSFSVSADGGRFEWMGGGTNWRDTTRGLFAQPRNLLSPSYLRMLRAILTFNERSVADLAAGALKDKTLGQYFGERGYPQRLLTDYFAPMGASIWSTPARQIEDFPAERFVDFFATHRLLQYDRPRWRSIAGGSRCYVEKLTAPFRDQIRLGCAVTGIERTARGVTITDSQGGQDSYDHVVITAHSDQALAMLSDASAQEREILGAIRYSPNQLYLHRDPRLMPKRRNAWACWNYLRWPRHGDCVNDLAVTYWMNPLQALPDDKPLFVSLNPPFEPDPALTFGRYDCEHPLYDTAAFSAQQRLQTLQGQRHTWYAGAWSGYGFHEDGIRSGLAVAEALGAPAPWRKATGPFSEAAE